jgi:hypothetical protein
MMKRTASSIEIPSKQLAVVRRMIANTWRSINNNSHRNISWFKTNLNVIRNYFVWCRRFKLDPTDPKFFRIYFGTRHEKSQHGRGWDAPYQLAPAFVQSSWGKPHRSSLNKNEDMWWLILIATLKNKGGEISPGVYVPEQTVYRHKLRFRASCEYRFDNSITPFWWQFAFNAGHWALHGSAEILYKPRNNFASINDVYKELLSLNGQAHELSMNTEYHVQRYTYRDKAQRALADNIRLRKERKRWRKRLRRTESKQ